VTTPAARRAESAPAPEPVPAAEVEPAPAANVIEALRRVMVDMPGIGKDSHAAESQGGYAYRGIEAITRETQPLFAKHGVIFVPRVVEHSVRDITVAQRPWTDTSLSVVYRVYGPGGSEDFIEVGPIVTFGRDNSDKGANKCMTQALKYALLQTLCISDTHDDADGSTHEADTPPPEVTPQEQARFVLFERIRNLSADGKGALGTWCEDNGVPRRVTKMTDAQVEAAADFLDRLDAETDPEPPNGAEGTDGAGDPENAAQGQPQARQTPLPGSAEADAKAEAVDAIIEHVRQMDRTALLAGLTSFGLDTKGSDPTLRQRLAQAMVNLGFPQGPEE
jgi:hypothetical protein